MNYGPPIGIDHTGRFLQTLERLGMIDGVVRFFWDPRSMTDVAVVLPWLKDEE